VVVTAQPLNQTSISHIGGGSWIARNVTGAAQFWTQDQRIMHSQLHLRRMQPFDFIE